VCRERPRTRMLLNGVSINIYQERKLFDYTHDPKTYRKEMCATVTSNGPCHRSYENSTEISSIEQFESEKD
jgi:hypothetical protein